MAEQTPSGVNAGARLDRLPFSRFHTRMFFLIAAGAFFDAFDLFIAGGILGWFVKSGFSDLQQNATFISATFLGMVIGAWSAGILGDRYGRRFSYQFNLALFGLASLAAVFAPNMTVLTGLRFIMGIGLGAELVIAYPALGEFVPPAYRGRWLASLTATTNFAQPIAAFLGYLIIPTIGWQWLFAIAGAGAMVIWVMRKSMPESPRWLETKGRDVEAEEIVRRIEAEAEREGPLPPVRPGPAKPPAGAVSLLSLFKPPLLQRTLIGMLIHATSGFVNFGFFAWLPTFFVKQGFTITSSLGWTATIAIGAPLGAVIGALISDRFDRKPSIIITAVISAIFGAVYPNVGDGPLLLVVAFLLMTSFYMMLSLAYGLYVSELFPTEVRMRGVSVCNTTGRIVTAGIQFLIVWIFPLGGVTTVVSVIVGLLMLVAISVGLFGIETRQKSLEAISRRAA
jgi:putative MFS transporter